MKYPPQADGKYSRLMVCAPNVQGDGVLLTPQYLVRMRKSLKIKAFKLLCNHVFIKINSKTPEPIFRRPKLHEECGIYMLKYVATNSVTRISI